MNYRDKTTENFTPPYQDGKWIYPDSIYDNILNLFLRTQRPEGIYKENTRLRDPFRKINKFKMQKYLNHSKKPDYRELDWVTDKDGVIRAAIIYYDIKKMHSKKKNVISFTQKKITLTENDSYIYDVACDNGDERYLGYLIERHFSKHIMGTTIIECDMQLKRIRDLFVELGFERIDNKVSSFADMYGIWSKQNKLNPIDKIEISQECSLQQFSVPEEKMLECKIDELLKQVKELEDDSFANHYSNYNKGNTWKGVVLRGYNGREDFIIKPSEMTNSWKKENKEKLDWVVEDTPLRKKLSAIESFIGVLTSHGITEFERIRILKLAKNEGELERHTDIQDKEAGINDGQWARLHFPLQTNSGVQFTQWNTDGTKTNAHMKVGELWYLDMRKPHTAVNFGEEDRYHLIIDIKADHSIREWLKFSLLELPPHKEADDYED